MIATLRRQHGGGRDFLQENKQRVSKMETNGRCLAAASARRVPLWRPVALHYTEKLRPHLNFGGQRRSRLGQVPPDPELRSGLAQPYMGFVPGAGVTKLAPPCGHELARRRQAEQQEQVRLQGGWVDPRRKERPVRRCCHQECQCHQAAEVPVSVPPPMKAGEGDQADRLSQCPSRVSRASQKERSMAGEQNVEPEAPLSARSSASALTHKPKRSVSQESNRSNVTVKSNITVASTKTNVSKQSNVSKLSSASKQSNVSKLSSASKQSNASKQSSASKHTITSKKSQVSHKSGPMEEMPLPEYQEREHYQHQHQHHQHQHHQHQHHQPHQHSEPKGQEPVHQDYEGYTPLTPEQRQAVREDAQLKYGKLMEEYNHLPVSAPTLRVRSRRIAIEKQLDELDYAINMFDQPHMDMYYKR